MPQKTYPTEFKIEVVKYYKCHHTVAETLARYGIAESTLFRWKREYESRRFLRLGKSGEADKRAPLQSHITKMEQIVEVLRQHRIILIAQIRRQIFRQTNQIDAGNS